MSAFANILIGGVFHAAVLFLVAAGLQVGFGVQKIFNLACGSFYALGAYTGVSAVAYDHFDSRAGDPQLHTHVVVANKVNAVLDGRWRSLDGRPIYASLTALSAHYNGLLADRLARDLGIVWELRERATDRNPQWEIPGISDELIREFSSRSREIDLEKDRLIDAYIARHGRRPSATKIIEFRAELPKNPVGKVLRRELRSTDPDVIRYANAGRS